MKEGWEYKKLGDCCDVEYGTRVVQKKDGGTIYPVYGGGGETFRMDRYNREDSIVIARFAMSKTCVRYVSGKFFLNDSGLSVKAGDGLLQSYMNYHLFSLNDEIFNLGKGAAQRNLDVRAFKELKISIPLKSMQLKIVAELDKINEIIDLKKAQLKDLDLLAQSIFYDIFGDPIENPKGWEVKSVGSICSDVKYGTSKPACEGGKYKYLRMNNLTVDGHLDFTNLKYIDIPDTEIEKCIVRKGDILFNRTNSIDLVGKTCEFTADEPMVIAGYIIRVRLISSVHPTFFSVCFNTPAIKKLLRKIAKGAVNQANINSKELQAIAIILPPLSLQQSFADKIEAIESQKSAIKKSLAEVETLLASRMDYYFN